MRSLIKYLFPPIIYKKIKLFLGKQGNYFTGEYKSWNDALVHCKGYDDEDILNKLLPSAQKVKNGEMEYERDGILFDSIEYSWEVLAGIIWVAARNSGCLCVLDMGGSLGTTYFQNKKFLIFSKNLLINVYIKTNNNSFITFIKRCSMQHIRWPSY